MLNLCTDFLISLVHLKISICTPRDETKQNKMMNSGQVSGCFRVPLAAFFFFSFLSLNFMAGILYIRPTPTAPKASSRTLRINQGKQKLTPNVADDYYKYHIFLCEMLQTD